MNSGRTVALVVAAGVVAGALLLGSCASGPINVVAPASVPGASFVGDKVCAECHADIARGFPASAHARLRIQDAGTNSLHGCESCHGAGSLHVNSGGGSRFILNPGKEPATCLACHRNVEAEFHLPRHHPVLEGRMSCAACHDPHGGDVFKPASGLALGRLNESCAQCHREQTRPFTFEHAALREGCAACHTPHGSANAGLLAQRDLNLCLRCHAQVQGASVNPRAIYIGRTDHTTFVRMGACWSSGCHTAVHGSNVDPRLRY